MIGIIGIAIVFIMVFGGYVIAGGKLGIILKAAPFELIMILGAAVGAFVLANDGATVKHTLKDIGRVFKGPKWGHHDYQDLLCLLFELIRIARSSPVALEEHIENPGESSVFGRYEKIRGDGKDFPILVLTARGDWSDKVDALGIGADDYLVKPFHVQEFLARLDALVRRASGQFKPSLSIGPINLDMRGKRVAVDGEAIELTAYEFNLLEYLMQRPGEVVSKTELTEYLYEQDFDRDSNVIEVFVGRLRKKLDPENSLKPISTVRGQGYRLALSTT